MCDRLIAKGYNLQDEQFCDQIMQRTADNLVQSGLVNLQKTDLSATKLITVTTKMPTKRLANRRASAGVQQSLGIRRKSVTPMTAQQMQAKAELQNFEKHEVK